MPSLVNYSVGINLGDLKNASNVTSVSGTFTFTAGQADNIGVGDEIDYDVDNKIAYITSRLSDTVYNATTATGATPGDVSGVTVNAIKRAFNSLLSAESGSSDANHLNFSDLVANDTILFWWCYADGDDTASVNVSGYTTDATRTIAIATPVASVHVGVSQRHSGTMASSGYRIIASEQFAGIIGIDDAFVNVSGLKIVNTRNPETGSIRCLQLDGTGEYRIHSNVINCSHTNLSTSGNDRGISLREDCTAHIYNNIVYHCGSGIHKSSGAINNGTIYNNTCYNNGDTGIQATESLAENNMFIKNNLCYNNFEDYLLTNPQGTANNLSSDATSPEVSLRNKIVAFVDAGSDNFLLDVTDSSAVDAGIDLSADTEFSVVEDILGTARPISSAYDIGAHEANTAIVDYYVDLAISTTVAVGSELDPFGYDQFQARMNSTTESNITYKIKNSHDYVFSGSDSIVDRFLIDNKINLILQAWILTAPPRIRFTGDPSVGSGNPAIKYAILIDQQVTTSTYTFKNLLIQDDTIPLGATTNNFIRFLDDSAPNALVIENCYLIKSDVSVATTTFIGHTENNLLHVAIRGSALIMTGSTATTVHFIDVFASSILDLDSSYFESDVATDLFDNITSLLGAVKYCAFYGAAVNNTPAPVTDLNNITGTTKEYPSVNVITANIKTDILPASGSPVLNAGNPSLSLSTDIVNDFRTFDPNPDIGPIEFVGAIVCDFVGVPTSGEVPLKVNFFSIAIEGIDNYLWDFGDGGSSTLQNPVHTYNAVGLYDVTLTVFQGLNSGFCQRLEYIAVFSQGVGVPSTNKCFRLATKPEQGISFSELGGDNFVFPRPRSGTVRVYSNKSTPLVLAVDPRTGKIFLLATKDNTVDSGIKKVYMDRVGDSYAGSTEIPWSIKLKSHLGSRNQHFLEHLDSHLFLRAQDPKTIGQDGFDQAGIRSAQSISMKLYRDNKLDSETETTKIPLNGDITVQKRVIAHELQLEYSGTASQLRITGANTDYEMRDEREGPDGRVMGHHSYQLELSDPIFWLTRGLVPTFNLATSKKATGSVFGQTTGPDTKVNSAMVFSPASVVTDPIQQLGDFTVMFGTSTIISTTDIMRIGNAIISIVVELSKYKIRFSLGGNHDALLSWDGSGFVLIKISRTGNNIVFSEEGKQIMALAVPNTQIGGIIELINGSKTVFDPRLYSKTISEDANAYYRDDIRNNKGNSTLPL